MAIIRVHNNQNYQTTSVYHLRDTSLSWQAMGMLSFMLSCSDKFKFSIEGLTECSKNGSSCTRATLNELKDKGYVRTTRLTDDKGRIIEWIYDIYETPNDASLHVGEPHVEFQHVENPIQRSIINNTISNKDKSIEDISIKDIPPISPNGGLEVEVLSKEKELFEEFRKVYRGTKRGLDTEFANFQKKHKDWKQVAPLLLPAYQRQCEQLDERKAAGGFVPQPKNLQTYINQRCWEEEVQPQLDFENGNSINQSTNSRTIGGVTYGNVYSDVIKSKFGGRNPLL